MFILRIRSPIIFSVKVIECSDKDPKKKMPEAGTKDTRGTMGEQSGVRRMDTSMSRSVLKHLLILSLAEQILFRFLRPSRRKPV